MAYFPMMVELTDRRVLVVGGGEEGTKKIKILHEFGCLITLIAKEASTDAARFSDVFLNRDFKDSDISNEYAFIVAATENEDLNKRIFILAKEKKIPVNVVDNVRLCTFIFPAIVKEEDVVVSVSSGGKSPYIAQHIKSLIQDVLPKGVGKINNYMGGLREQARRDIPDRMERRRFLRLKLEEALK